MKIISKLLIGVSSLLLVNVNAETNISISEESLESILATNVPHIENDADLCQVRGFDASIVAPVIKAELIKIERYKTIVSKDPNYVSRLTNQLLGVSECFSIDPLVFSSLIGHESYYYNYSVSRTGAIGLGQLTTISLKEIAQQLHAPSTDKYERSSKDTLEYFNSAISCVQDTLNRGVAMKHWWKYTETNRKLELKRNTLLNLTYAAMMYKISYSKSLTALKKAGKTVKNVDELVKKLLNYYNGASAAEQLSHYRMTQKNMNIFLEALDDTDNICYNKV